MTDLVTLIGTSLPRAAARWFPDVTWRMPEEERVAYLTFDDGPNPGLTPRIAAVLERHDAMASFFMIGSKVKRDPALVRMLVDAGHTTGNHTYSHVDAWRTDAPVVARELHATTAVLEDVTGRRVAWMRPPYGRFTRSMRRWCLKCGQTLTMWDLGTGDFLQRVTTDHVLRHVAGYVRAGSVIVLHDNPCCAATTLQALDDLLEHLTQDGWRFAALPV
jgi:peptidoglycan/xylan/chitin deacetylase (PgdA/CDA1 family)